jgi:hypothetical protein
LYPYPYGRFMFYMFYNEGELWKHICIYCPLLYEVLM